ncbi:MAG TPA: hypothetical protein VEH27_14270 [Methylomirabilota bacterium]|nr:hypothetical protein [Methylomirabilota bacterium]
MNQNETLAALAMALQAMGAPAHKCEEMAAQLDKRAKQLAAEKGQTYDQALSHLIGLMQQGWSAKERGF